MENLIDRRQFLRTSATAAGSLGLGALEAPALAARKRKPPFKLSLAEWSLHRALFSGKLDNLDFPRTAKVDYGISAVEYVNQFFKDKARDPKYLAQLKKRAKDHGVENRLIMIDEEGSLGASDNTKRTQAVENHYRWVEAAKALGCFAIRVNAHGDGTRQQQMDQVADGLHRLSQFGARHKISVIVENHGGLSSDGQWLSAVMRKVNLPNCGTLPDFGNFETYDRYKGVAELMPFAKAVSAKSHDFDAQGNEVHTDYRRMLKIVSDAGYHSFLGIEYEGDKLSEPDGIRATRKLIEKVMVEMD
ncbi:MAG TPA: sugar phosphate isomerase/epimerase family protein [Acidobacteriota bacterium]|jgi:sugar phosphate isomerase/epimerase